MALRLLHTTLLLCCVVAGLTSMFLAAVLVYATEPTAFTWRSVPPDLPFEEAEAEGAASDACTPLILDRAPVAFKSVGDFATEAVLSVNSYDYLTWDQALPDALNTYFTPEAARTYYGQFGRSRLLRTVTDSYYTVSALSSRPAMVVASGQVEGVRSWTIQVPVTLRYQTGVTNREGGTTAHAQNEVFTVTVLEQRPNRQNFRGVAVNDITNETVRVLDDLDRLE